MMLLELLEDFSDMASVFFFGVGVDEYVIEVYQYTNIEQVAKNVIHEALECGGCVGESERHYAPFKGAIQRSHSESGKPSSICRPPGFRPDGRHAGGRLLNRIWPGMGCRGGQ